MMTTLIQNCSLLDSSSPKGYIEHQDILICDHRIAAVQSTGAIANSDRVIDGQGLLALPGLINSHTHSPENILRATVEQLHLELWLVIQDAALALPGGHALCLDFDSRPEESATRVGENAWVLPHAVIHQQRAVAL